jgi:multidrug resistance efflux pump
VLERARLNLERMKGLYEKQDISRSAFDDARRDYDVAEANLKEAVDHEQLVNAPPLPEEIAKADSEIAASESKIRVISEKMGKCQVRAPIDGTILRVLLRKGESFSMITPRPLFRIADLSVRRVRAEVDERDVPKVRAGQKVVIFSDARPDLKVGGSVERLASAMGRKKILTGDPSEKADVDVLEAMIDLDPGANHLPVGMRVVVQFLR